jgi:hypothetical protein
MKRDKVEKRRELAEETGMVISENDPEKSLQEFLEREKSPAGKNARATTNGNSIISHSPKKKARRFDRQKSNQNDKHPCAPDNGKLFSPMELHNVLLPLDSAARWPLVICFSEKDWLHYKGKHHCRSVCQLMQKSSLNPDRIKSCWNNIGRPGLCDKK